MCWDRAVGGITPIVSIEADLKGEGGREANLEVCFSLTSCSFVGALSVITGHFRDKVACV